MMNNAPTPKDFPESGCSLCRRENMNTIVSFEPSPSSLVNLFGSLAPPPPLLPRLFSSLSERARPVGVGNDKCLPQVSGKQRRHDKCIAFRRSSLSLDEKQPVSLESANPTLRASKLSSTVKFELIDTFCGYLLPDSKGGGGIILFIVGTILLLFARRSNRIDGKLIIM